MARGELTAAMNKQAELLETLIGLHKTAAKKTKEHREEQEKAELGLIAYKDSMRGLSAEISNVNNYSKEMGRTMAQVAQESKVWTAASRLLSGTGLWSIQNAIRGVIDVFAIWDTAQQKSMDRQNQAAKVMENYEEVKTKYREEQEKLNLALDEGKKAAYWEESAAYKLMRAKGIAHKTAVKLIKEEMELMGEMIKKQEKIIEGGWLSKKTADMRARAGLKIRKVLKDTFDDREKFTKKVGKEKGLGRMTNRLDAHWDFGAKGVDMLKGFKEARRGLFFDPGERRETTGDKKGRRIKGLSYKRGGEEGKESGFHNVFGDKGTGFIARTKAFSKAFSRGKLGKTLINFSTLITKKVIPNLMWVLSKLKMAMLWFILGLAAIMAIRPLLESLWEGAKEAFAVMESWGIGLWGQIEGIWKSAQDFFGAVFKMAQAVWEGDIWKFADYAWKALLAAGELILKVGGLALSVLFASAMALGFGIWDWIKDEGPIKLMELLLALGLILIGYHIAGQALAMIGSIVLGIIGSIPIGLVLLGVFLTALLYKIVEWAARKIGSYMPGGEKPSEVPPMATGGISKGGRTLVGERGPEFVDLPRGSRVYSNNESRKMVGKPITNNISVNVNGRVGASDQELRDIARKVGSMVSQEINRTTASSTRGI